MLVPIQWLKEYAPVPESTEEFCEKMIMSGSNLESVARFGENFQRTVVGQVVKKEAHPNADRLSVCQVDVGEETVQIVCGAPNVEEGMKVPVALHKSRIPGPLHGQPKSKEGVKITKGKLRGVESYGMICAASELGFEDKVLPLAHKDGIWPLPQDAPVGEELPQAMELVDQVVDFEITPNRSDCLAMIGMARETVATFGGELAYPDTSLKEEAPQATRDLVEVEIKDTQGCPRYVARAVTQVKIQHSPWWMQRRLMMAGMRPINNIVDITNYVMLEYGHPIHAFDIRQIKSKKIVIDKSSAKETFTTLDGQKRNLDDQVLMIFDGEEPIAIAGIMGGLDSQVVEDTQTIIIEAANFEADGIRRSSKMLGLRTEASARFEKGIDPNLSLEAINRVCHLIEVLDAGKVAQGAVDEYPRPTKPQAVALRPQRVNRVLGTELQTRDMVDILQRLEIEVKEEGSTLWVTPPGIRLDLTIEEDFIEEIARIYGYDALPKTLPRSNQKASMAPKETLMRLARQTLCAMGLNEIQTYSFVSAKDMDKIQIDEEGWERSFVEIENPLGEENAVMRTLLTPAMLETLSRNHSRKVEDVAAFEIGKTYTKNLLDPDALPEEQTHLCLGMYGPNRDFFTLKGILEALLTTLGIDDIQWEPESEYEVYHPGRCARIATVAEANLPTGELLGGEMALDDDAKGNEAFARLNEMIKEMSQQLEHVNMELGIMGEIHPRVLENYDLPVPCYCCEIIFDTLVPLTGKDIRYTPLPKFPAITRDIALVVQEEVTVGAISQAVKDTATEILESIELFDIYRGEQVGEGLKSLAFRLTYRDRERTLTDEEVTRVNDGVLEMLKEKFNATLREM